MRTTVLVVVVGVLAVTAAAQTPPEAAKITRADFDRLPGAAMVTFEGRSWSKGELVAEIDKRRRKAPPSGFDLGSVEASRIRVEKEWRQRVEGESTGNKARIRRPSGGLPDVTKATGPRITEVKPETLVPDCTGSWGTRTGVIRGSGFGESGTAQLLGKFKGGSLELKRADPAQIGSASTWGVPPSGDPAEAAASSFYFEIPCGITGVPDHDARAQVVVGGKASNEFPLRFVARREVVKVQPAWIQQSISGSAESSVVLRPKDFTKTNGWELYGAKHTGGSLASGTDIFKVVAPSPCTPVQAEVHWGPLGGQASALGFVWEKSRKLQGNTLELELGWVLLGDGVFYGVQVSAMAPAGLACGS